MKQVKAPGIQADMDAFNNTERQMANFVGQDYLQSNKHLTNKRDFLTHMLSKHKHPTTPQELQLYKSIKAGRDALDQKITPDGIDRFIKNAWDKATKRDPKIGPPKPSFFQRARNWIGRRFDFLKRTRLPKFRNPLKRIWAAIKKIFGNLLKIAGNILEGLSMGVAKSFGYSIVRQTDQAIQNGLQPHNGITPSNGQKNGVTHHLGTDAQLSIRQDGTLIAPVKNNGKHNGQTLKNRQAQPTKSRSRIVAPPRGQGVSRSR